MDPFTPTDGYGQVLHWSLIPGLPRIIRLDEHRVLKRAITDCRETDAMQFIATNTSIPVPRVYETRFSGKRKSSYIVMDYMPGESLDEAWPKLTHDQRISICHELRGYLSQLQKLKGKRIEAVNGGAVTVGLRFPRQGGPFETEKEFNGFLVEKDNEGRPSIFKRYARAGLADNHEIHLAHGDFSPRNILIDENCRVTAVLD